ncbi:PREDICTED: uncharacterized protein LOC105958717 [Erythranthe guttata]|uniref:uncharacterized protein LOC105958717 n=1 Tax=Erythranthe guttata TaxID=4155 RepID=UPI00064DA0F9|nr:PREDICTED: uncharacterized protein LOC105958717 [Erythranthe guttata]|eukprot:XP_012838176.1 PREDICTED: uncharacterized protein LOC105958717 [Erythranthe guttata]
MAAEFSVSLKLLIDTKSKRVLFAEAGKDCVDFLFYILSLPVANLINLVGKQQMVGSLGNLYESLENLNESYVQTKKNKDALLKPATIRPIGAVSSSVPPLALKDAPNNTAKKFYTCLLKCDYVTDDSKTLCPKCLRAMSTVVPYVSRSSKKESSSSTEEGGFVKGVVTYMVMDDLVVKPMSTISSLTLLNKFNVKEVSALQEKEVNLGMAEVFIFIYHLLRQFRILEYRHDWPGRSGAVLTVLVPFRCRSGAVSRLRLARFARLDGPPRQRGENGFVRDSGTTGTVPISERRRTLARNQQ